jgi:hypothetical protein
MFDTAYTSGESSLGNRDRLILRAFALPGVEFTRSFSMAVPVNYTADGVPDFTNTIISESGKTVKEMLQYCFTITDKLLSARHTVDNPWTPETIDYINSTIPSKYTQKFNRTGQMAELSAVFNQNTDASQLNDTMIWFIKACMIGPAYLAWLAENKWKLDLTWTP